MKFLLFYVVLQESQLSPRRSVGDVFGCRVGGSNPDLERNQKNSGPTTVSSKTYGAPGDFKAELTRKLSNEKNASGHVENARIDESFNRSGSNHALVGRSVGRQENQLKHSASPDHPSLIRSATWLEVGKIFAFNDKYLLFPPCLGIQTPEIIGWKPGVKSVSSRWRKDDRCVEPRRTGEKQQRNYGGKEL